MFSKVMSKIITENIKRRDCNIKLIIYIYVYSIDENILTRHKEFTYKSIQHKLDHFDQ